MRRSRVFRMGPDIGPQETGRKEAVVVHYTDTKRIQVDPAKIKTHKIKTKEERGREAWEYVHTSNEPLEKIVKKFESMIPCGECKAGYRDLIAIHPFDLSSPDAFFASTVVLHNAVNQKLIDKGDTSKRIVSLDEARAIWNRPKPDR